MNSRLIAMALVTGVAALVPTLAIAAPDAPGKGQRLADKTETRADLEASLKARFAKLDANKDGYVTRAEAEAAGKAMQDKHEDAAFAVLDSNKDGSISRDEFAAAHDGSQRVRHRVQMHGGRNVDRMFDRADTNKDGKLSYAEFSAKPLQWFDAADTNKDGQVTPAERKAAWDVRKADWKARHADGKPD